jgi:hypothetical protein
VSRNEQTYTPHSGSSGAFEVIRGLQLFEKFGSFGEPNFQLRTPERTRFKCYPVNTRNGRRMKMVLGVAMETTATSVDAPNGDRAETFNSVYL